MTNVRPSIGDAGAAAPWPLPDGWDWVSLGDLCDVAIGGTPDRRNATYWGQGHIWLSIADLNGGLVSSSAEQITTAAVENSSVKLVDAGTVLMSFKLSIGKLGIAEVPLYTNEAIAALPIRPEWESRMHTKYLFHALRAAPLTAEADFAVKGRTLNKRKIARLAIPVPFVGDPEKSLASQVAIVEHIEAVQLQIDEALALVTDLRRGASDVLRAAVDEAFAADSETAWPGQAQLSELVAIRAPLVDPKLPGYAELPHAGVDAIEAGTTRLRECRTAREDGVISGKYLFAPGDVLYGKIRPNLRKAALASFVGLCSADVYPLTVVHPELNSRFLTWALVSPRFTEYAVGTSARARMPKINRPDLLAYTLSFPADKDQERIAHDLDRIADEVQLVRAAVEPYVALLHDVERAVLSSSFRGALPASKPGQTVEDVHDAL